MPRISLYRPQKGNDYKFIDKIISEQFTVGGTDFYIHKYLGPKNPDAASATADQPQYDAIKETNIQDLLFLENRDRKYDQDVYHVRGIYNVQDLDFNLSQFGLFIDNDTVFATVHINDFISIVGRKPMSGDAIEIPHLRDEFALNDYSMSLPRFFVISDVGRAAEGFSPTWWPHLYRLKLNKLGDEAQFSDILVAPADQDANFKGDYDPTVIYRAGEIVRYQGKLYTVTNDTNGQLPPDTGFFEPYTGPTLQELLSTGGKNNDINDALLAQAEDDAALSGYETRQFFTLAVNENDALLDTADITDVDASYEGWDASLILERPKRSGYTGYLLGDGVPENGADFGHGNSFPPTPTRDDFFLRTDFLPNRLFRYNGHRWIKHEDAVRHTLTNTSSRRTLKTSFINNNNVNEINGEMVKEKQDISKVLKPRADF